MNTKNVLIALAVAAIVIPVLKAVYDWAQAADNPPSLPGNSPKVKKIVSETLKQHEGEESPFVQAFANAVE